VGGEFWDGFTRGVTITAVNHLAHKLIYGPGDRVVKSTTTENGETIYLDEGGDTFILQNGERVYDFELDNGWVVAPYEGSTEYTGTAPVPGFKGPNNLPKAMKAAKKIYKAIRTGRLSSKIRRHVKRVDRVNYDRSGKPLHNGQPELHLKDGRSINLNSGTWKHGEGTLPTKVLEWLNSFF